jgi:hypothetical protein
MQDVDLEEISLRCQLICAESGEACFKVQQEFLSNYNNKFFKGGVSETEHLATYLFYKNKICHTQPMIGFHLGFIAGMCQAHSIETAYSFHIIKDFSENQEYEIQRYFNVLNINHNGEKYIDYYKKMIEEDAVERLESVTTAYTLGLADGKGYGDYKISFETDFSILHNKDKIAASNLNGFSSLLQLWLKNVLEEYLK